MSGLTNQNTHPADEIPWYVLANFQEAVNVSLDNLLSYPFVKEAVDDGKIALRGAHYNFVKGVFDLWEKE